MFNLEGRMPVFMDLEFTGLHQNTTLMSIALVIGNRQFYAELTDYDETQLNPWLQTNVIENFMLDNPGWEESENAFMIKGTTKEVVEKLKEFLDSLGPVYIVSDVLAYDWVLFCELFGGAFGVPSNVYYIPVDLSTLFVANGLDPDLNRQKFSRISGDQHNALMDALMVQACFKRLKSREFQPFREGDIVSDPSWGDGRVKKTTYSERYPIQVEFETQTIIYTEDGREHPERNPTLQHGTLNNWIRRGFNNTDK